MTVITYRRNQSVPISCEDLDNNFDALRERTNHVGFQLASTISDLKVTVEGYDFILALQQCCTDLTIQLADLQESLFGDGELSTIVNNLRNELLQEIAELQTDLTALTGRVTTAESNIVSINTNITALNSSVVNLQNTKANINSPSFTGVPLAPTPISGSPSGQIATVGFVNNIINQVIASLPDQLPLGTILEYSVGGLPSDNYVVANGQAISRSEYAEYFALVGTFYGAGDGSSTFNVPNRVNRVGVGAGDAYGLNALGGAATHTLSWNEMPAHSHTADSHGHTINDPSHDHTTIYHQQFNNPTNSDPGGGELSASNFGAGSPLANIVEPASTGITINQATVILQNSGGGAAHNNMPPYIALNYIVKVK